MMEKSNENKANLRDRINSNKYLLYKLAKKESDKQDVSLSDDSLERSRIKLYEDMLKWMPFTNTNLFRKRIDPILPEIEQGAKIALYERKERTSYYDPVVFTESMISAIDSYSPEKGTKFTTWFSTLYAQKITKQLSDSTSIAEQHFTSKLSRSEIKSLRSIINYIEKSGLSIYSLSDEALDKIAAQYDHDKEWLKELLRLKEAQFNITSANVVIDEDDGDDTIQDMLEDVTSAAPFRSVEILDELNQAVDIIATEESKEIINLLWNNLFLHPLKDKLSENEANFSSSPIEYLEVLKKLEPVLINKIFVRPYLCFCLRTPPIPDSIDHIYECESIRPFIQKTICDYLHVSAAYTSEQARKFKSFQKELGAYFMRQNM